MKKEIKKLVRAACRRGWRRLPDGKHYVIQHIASGVKVTMSITPSDGMAHWAVKRDIARVEREWEEKEAA